MQLTSSTWWAFQYLQNSSRIWLRILSIALEGELNVLDFVQWLNYYYFVLLDCFPLFLHFLTSLIELLFGTRGRPRRLKFFYKQEAGGGHWKGDGAEGVLLSWEGPIGYCLVTVVPLSVHGSLD